MMLPKQSALVARSVSTMPLAGGLQPSGCSIGKKLLCAAALGTCGIVCASGAVPACVQCLGALGMSSCVDCL